MDSEGEKLELKEECIVSFLDNFEESGVERDIKSEGESLRFE